MNFGPLIFLGVFLTMATSWFGMVLVPQMQFGRSEPVKIESSGQLYPAMPPGEAHQGAEVYRANGCYYCHSQQVRQYGYEFDVQIVEAGTNTEKVINAMMHLDPNLGTARAKGMLKKMPVTFLSSVSLETANKAYDLLSSDKIGAKVNPILLPLGADIKRGWGTRRSVAADYLYDAPAMIGQQRVGPDLTNVGIRHGDIQWNLLHLYNPKITTPGSLMPPYPYLFKMQKIEFQPSPDALKLPKEFAVKDGYEVVPKPAARELAAYIASLKVDTALYEAPMGVPATAPTNTTATATNTAPAAAAPTK